MKPVLLFSSDQRRSAKLPRISRSCMSCSRKLPSWSKNSSIHLRRRWRTQKTRSSTLKRRTAYWTEPSSPLRALDVTSGTSYLLSVSHEVTPKKSLMDLTNYSPHYCYHRCCFGGMVQVYTPMLNLRLNDQAYILNHYNIIYLIAKNIILLFFLCSREPSAPRNGTFIVDGTSESRGESIDILLGQCWSKIAIMDGASATAELWITIVENQGRCAVFSHVTLCRLQPIQSSSHRGQILVS